MDKETKGCGKMRYFEEKELMARFGVKDHGGGIWGEGFLEGLKAVALHLDKHKEWKKQDVEK